MCIRDRLRTLRRTLHVAGVRVVGIDEAVAVRGETVDALRRVVEGHIERAIKASQKLFKLRLGWRFLRYRGRRRRQGCYRRLRLFSFLGQAFYLPTELVDTLLHDTQPVSYTHLDVYKRQVRAAVGIERVLEKARHQHAFMPLRRAENLLRAIAVVHVEVDHRDTLDAGFFQRISGRYGDVVEYAKAHRPVLGGMMATRTHRAECIAGMPGHQLVDRQDTRTGCAPCRVEAVRVHGRVRIKLHITLFRRVLENEVDV